MMMGAGMIGMVAFWALLIWASFNLVTRVTPQNAPQPTSALDILEQQFVRGEIDLDELESRRSKL